MFNSKRLDDMEQQNWTEAKSRGKPQFIVRHGLAPTLLIWLVVPPAIELLDRTRHSSVLRVVAINLMLLPVFLLGGLESVWKWKDMQKKYPE